MIYPTPTRHFRATNTKLKGEFAGPWKVLSWDFVNREVYVLPETDDHLEGGSQECWSYNDVIIEQLIVSVDKSGNQATRKEWVEL